MKSLRIFAGIVLLGTAGLGLSGCASGFRSVNSGVTTLQNYLQGSLVPMTTFSTTDIIRFYVSVTWDDVTEDPDWQVVDWNWYKDGKIVGHYENDRAVFRGAPNLRFITQPAAALGVGHFSVECIIGGKQVATAEFDVK
jgi:hypothetical protein